VSTRFGVLSGITVVAAEQAVAAPFATRQLADLGARVIKIERPGGGDFARGYDTVVKGLSSHFVWLNRGKESLTLDLKRPDGKQVLDRLLARADVFVQNLAPAAADRLGLAARDLARRYPRLITCSLSGYGQAGSFGGKKAYDLLVQGEAGLISITGGPDQPAKAGIAVADIAGGMYAFSGILAALLDRERGGTARHVEISLFEALAEWMGFPLYYEMYGPRRLRRSGARHASIQPYGPFAAADGVVLLGVQNEREFARFCTDVLGRPELAGDPRFAANSGRCEHAAELARIIEDSFSGLTAAQLSSRLDAAGIANARLNTVQDLAAHPALSGRWRDIGSPAGPLRALLPPGIPGSVGPADGEPALGDVPSLGAHTEPVLAELGYDDAEVARLRDSGVV
jgi:itaconate CoA-transferase